MAAPCAPPLRLSYIPAFTGKERLAGLDGFGKGEGAVYPLAFVITLLNQMPAVYLGQTCKGLTAKISNYPLLGGSIFPWVSLSMI
jgi:hypothetical protein